MLRARAAPSPRRVTARNRIDRLGGALSRAKPRAISSKGGGARGVCPPRRCRSGRPARAGGRGRGGPSGPCRRPARPSKAGRSLRAGRRRCLESTRRTLFRTEEVPPSGPQRGPVGNPCDGPDSFSASKSLPAAWKICLRLLQGEPGLDGHPALPALPSGEEQVEILAAPTPGHDHCVGIARRAGFMDDQAGRGGPLLGGGLVLVGPPAVIGHGPAAWNRAGSSFEGSAGSGTAGSLISMTTVLPLDVDPLVVVPAVFRGDHPIADEDDVGVVDLDGVGQGRGSLAEVGDGLLGRLARLRAIGPGQLVHRGGILAADRHPVVGGLQPRSSAIREPGSSPIVARASKPTSGTSCTYRSRRGCRA